MNTVIGLGKAGCAIADKFSQYPQYKVYKIDSEGINKEEKRAKLLKRQETPEEYESSAPSLKTFFRYVSDDILFVVSGSGMVSGATLRILKQISKKNISVLYIKPDLEFLGTANALQERLVRNVLQEYARSHVISRLYMVDNKALEEILGDVPIVGYFDKLNDLIVSTVHMINVYNHQDPVHSTPFESSSLARISTFGVLDTETGKEKLFFSLDNVSEKSYYYAINQNTLETDGKLLRKLTEAINKNVDSKEVKTTFQVHSTSYDRDYGYLIVNTDKTNN